MRHRTPVGGGWDPGDPASLGSEDGPRASQATSPATPPSTSGPSTPTRWPSSVGGTSGPARSWTPPRPWRWPRPTVPADRRPGWCCSSPGAPTASSSTPTTTAARATIWRRIPRRRCSSTGRPSAARSASRDRSTRTTDAESDAYFATRDVGSRIGAYASHQSRPIAGRADLDAAMAEWTATFGGGDVPRPTWWGGWRITPRAYEFWQQGTNRLHDRVRYESVDARVDRAAAAALTSADRPGVGPDSRRAVCSGHGR